MNQLALDFFTPRPPLLVEAYFTSVPKLLEAWKPVRRGNVMFCENLKSKVIANRGSFAAHRLYFEFTQQVTYFNVDQIPQLVEFFSDGVVVMHFRDSDTTLKITCEGPSAKLDVARNGKVAVLHASLKKPLEPFKPPSMKRITRVLGGTKLSKAERKERAAAAGDGLRTRRELILAYRKAYPTYKVESKAYAKNLSKAVMELIGLGEAGRFGV